MTTPHKHAALIKAWADGSEIEVKVHTTSRLGLFQRWKDWREVFTTESPQWYTSYDFRIKPEPKPDVAQYIYISASLAGPRHIIQSSEDNVKYIFDGETGKLKSVEKL